MAKEDLELLEAVRNWRPTTDLHPIAMQAWTLYEDHGMSFPPAAVEQLRAALDPMKEDLAELARAMETLVRFSILISEKHNDEPGGKAVIELLREYAALFEPFWRKVGEALDNVGGEAHALFLMFTGATETKKTAPVVGKKPPEGTVPLNKLVTPARPPAWSKKDPSKPK